MNRIYHKFARLRIKILIGLLSFTIICNLSCESDGPTISRTTVTENLYAHFDDDFKTYLTQATQEMGKEILTYEDISPGLLPKKITITGNHYELGYLIGLIAKKKYGTVEKTRTPENEQINQEIINMYNIIDPEYLNLVRGCAEALGLSFTDVDLRFMEDAFFGDLWWKIFQYQNFVQLTDFSKPIAIGDGNCSLVSYYFENQQKHYVGRNFDNPSDRPHFFVNTQMNGRYAVMGMTCYKLYHWISDGVNDQGLFIGIATNGYPDAYNRKEPDYPAVPAVQIVHMIRIALETCTTVEEVINLFGSVRIWFPHEGNHLLLSDAAGNAAVVEFDLDRSMISFPRTHHYMVLTNTAYQEGHQFIMDHCWRYREATENLQGGIATQEDLLRVTSSIRATHGESRTLWSAITDLSERRMDVYYRSEDYHTAHTFYVSN